MSKPLDHRRQRPDTGWPTVVVLAMLLAFVLAAAVLPTDRIGGAVEAATAIVGLLLVMSGRGRQRPQAP